MKVLRSFLLGRHGRGEHRPDVKLTHTPEVFTLQRQLQDRPESAEAAHVSKLFRWIMDRPKPQNQKLFKLI